MSIIKVLLADDHQIVLDGLKMILDANEQITVVGEAENGVKVLEFLEKNYVDIVVLDINMPEMDGIRCSKKIKEKFPHVKIIILTMYAQKSFIQEIVQIGIDGCLIKNNTGKELAQAITRVHSGMSYYDQIQNFNSEDQSVKQHQLTERELDIIRALSEGLSSSQIGEKLFISEHTVKTHRKNILKKLDIHNSAELVQYAINNSII